MPRSLRLDSESDEQFRKRAERAGQYAKLLMDAYLNNACMQEYIADPNLPYSVKSARQSPTVRVEFEEAIAIGEIGETLDAMKSEYWGAGPLVSPLEPDDWFFATRITYIYRPNSRYHRRYEQRQRMKQLLGGRHRPLVEKA